MFLAWKRKVGLLEGFGVERYGGEVKKDVLSPELALARLKEGNVRFRENPEHCIGRLHERRRELLHVQRPWAVVLGCADSRVPPELVFGGLGLGDLFVVRNAGNLALDASTIGSIEYGTSVLGAPLVVVLGHQRCGAINAACKALKQGQTFPCSIGLLVRALQASVRSAAKEAPCVDTCTEMAVRVHAKRMARHLSIVSPILRYLLFKKKLIITPAIYNLDDGAVTWL